MKTTIELRTANHAETTAWLNEVDAMPEEMTTVRALQEAYRCILAGNLHYADRNLDDAVGHTKLARKLYKKGERQRDSRLHDLNRPLGKLRKNLRACPYIECRDALKAELMRAQDLLSK